MVVVAKTSAQPYASSLIIFFVQGLCTLFSRPVQNVMVFMTVFVEYTVCVHIHEVLIKERVLLFTSKSVDLS